MKHTTQQHTIGCACSSVAECKHNLLTEQKALEALIDDFTQHLKQKLIHLANEGKSGWDDERWNIEDILDQIDENLAPAGDMIDIAALAMFLWNRQDDCQCLQGDPDYCPVHAA
jgi:hypothetical protein